MDIVERAKGMILSPAREWRTIEPESGDAGYLFANYAAALAAIPPVCEALNRALFGWTGPRLHHLRHGFMSLHHHGFLGAAFGGLLRYLATFAALYVMAALIDGLAPTFSARKNREGALKLAVYAMTPAWLAGVFALVPALGFLRSLALLYAAYLFWIGLPILMKPPADKAGPYGAAALVAAVILGIVLAAIVGPIA